MISVIIPVYNGGVYLPQAIESVLAQTLPPDEVIVVDDGSTDNSLPLAQNYTGVHCLHIPHTGAAAARNRGVEVANGDYIGFLDADDVWVPEKLAWQLDSIAVQPNLEVVLGQVENFISDDCDEDTWRKLAGAVRVAPGYHVGAMLVRRSAFMRVGFFNETLKAGEFIDWWARAQEAHLVYWMLDQLVMRRRLHGANQTRLQRENLLDYTRVAQAALVRRRQKIQ